MAGQKPTRMDWGELDTVIDPVVVGLTVTKLLNADPMRLALMLQNSGSGNITVSTNPKVTAGNGIYLAAGSNPVYINEDTMPKLAGRLLYVIADAANANLVVTYARIIA